MANKVSGAKTVHKRRGGGGWRRRRGFRARRGSGSDGTSDEDYVVAEDEVEEDGSSYCSYSSDASLEDAGRDAEIISCSKDEEDEEFDASECEEWEAARGRRPRKGPAPAGSRRKPKGKSSRRRKSRVARVLDEVEAPRMRKPRAGSLRRSRISDEGEEEEYKDDEDEEFAPDDDGGDEEYLASSPVRKTGGRTDRPAKRQRRRRSTPRDSKGKDKKKKAPVKNRRWRMARSSDHDDFVVDDAVLVEGMNRKSRSSTGRKRRAKRPKMAPTSDDDDFVVEDGVLVERSQRTKGKKRKKNGVSNGKKKRPRVRRSDTSDSDFDYTICEEELRDLQIEGPLSRWQQKTVSSAAQDEKKGRAKEIDDVGKQICGICLSKEQKGAIRGLLDCCAHYFCFACIMEWSKVESRCPLCKERFKTISQSARSGSGSSLRAVVKRIPKRDQVYQPSEEEMRNYLDPYANVVCMECQRGGDDHLMLLCDICDSPAHTYCVGLGREVPEGNWYCDGCRSMDPGSSNPHAQESVVEHITRDSDLVGTYGETVSVDTTNCGAHETSRNLATLMSPHQSLSGVGLDASSGYHSPLREHATPFPASGFAASTLSGRRSIRRRIQIILSTNSRLTPEGVVGSVENQPSRIESNICSSEVDQPRETLHLQKESPQNGINGSVNRLFATPRAHMRPCMHDEATNFSAEEDTKARIQSMVKKHLNRLTRNNPLERRAFKDIARRATHTILAACGVQHRREMVGMPVEPPRKCVHPADGELSGLVKECCSVCFSSFVGNVVWGLVELNLQSM